MIDHPDEPGTLACSAAGTVADRLPSPLNLTGRSGYVQWVATEPDLRSRGAGRAVMQALLDWYAAEGITVVELHATAAGEPLYRSLGFDDEGPAALRRRAWLLGHLTTTHEPVALTCAGALGRAPGSGSGGGGGARGGAGTRGG